MRDQWDYLKWTNDDWTQNLKVKNCMRVGFFIWFIFNEPVVLHNEIKSSGSQHTQNHVHRRDGGEVAHFLFFVRNSRLKPHLKFVLVLNDRLFHYATFDTPVSGVRLLPKSSHQFSELWGRNAYSGVKRRTVWGEAPQQSLTIFPLNCPKNKYARVIFIV